MKKKLLVGIVVGSDSDLDMIQETINILKFFEINYEINIISAHRTPLKAHKYASTAKDRGVEVIIAAAGGAAHLPGVLASLTTLPVIGVPVQSQSLSGIDSLLSIVQMPSGVPVATMAIGKAGAKNAGIFAAEILGLKYPEINQKVEEYKKKIAKEVEEKNKKLQKKMKKG